VFGSKVIDRPDLPPAEMAADKRRTARAYARCESAFRLGFAEGARALFEALDEQLADLPAELDAALLRWLDGPLIDWALKDDCAPGEGPPPPWPLAFSGPRQYAAGGGDDLDDRNGQ
jgi:hypothetical protein